MIYFDNAATTKPTCEALEIFKNESANNYFNSSAQYSLSFNLYKDIEEIKKDISRLLCGNGKIVFTSGATEANNLAIFGSTFYKNKKYLFSSGEHPSVYNCAMELKNKGYNVDFISLKKNGEIDYDELKHKMDSNVCFVSAMLVNNETGAINDIKKIREIVDEKNKDCVLHTDCVQGLGKIKIDLDSWGVNLCSISAHKINGIKGIGALYISSNTKIKNIVFGGGQEYGLRSGTTNYPAIKSFYYSIKTAIQKQLLDFEKVLTLKNNLIDKLQSCNFNNLIIVSNDKCSPYITSLLFKGIKGETIMRYLSACEILISTGSACSSNKVGNRILENMGFAKNDTAGSIRISFSGQNTIEEIDIFVEKLKTFIDNYLK